MLLEFENAFLKRNNSEHSIPKSQNTSTLKTRKEKEKRKKSKSQHH
jgi:hypothetical protein